MAIFSKADRCFPRVFGGFLERFGSMERMDMEATPSSFGQKPFHPVLFSFSNPTPTAQELFAEQEEEKDAPDEPRDGECRMSQGVKKRKPFVGQIVY